MKKLLLLAFVLATPVQAQMLVNESKTTKGIGPAIALSEVDYETDAGSTFTFKRKTLGLTLNAPLNSDISALAQAGYTWKNEFEDGHDEGKGYLFGGGINGYFHRGSSVSFVGYALLNYLSDEFTPNKLEMTTTDMHFGALAVASASHNFDVYFGIDIVPSSDGKMKVDGVNVKYEREDTLGIKLGANIALGQGGTIRPELTLANEQTFALTATF